MTRANRWRQMDRSSEAALLSKVRPDAWHNPPPRDRYDLLIIGAGPAGLAASGDAIRLGLKVALIERWRLGGNSLNCGSVPSKALIRAAGHYATRRKVDRFTGALRARAEHAQTQRNFHAAMSGMRRSRARIAELSSAQRLRHAGIDLFFGAAHFTAADVVNVDGQELRFAKALIATGARPRSADIPGLEALGYLTSDTIFDLTDIPARLAIIGGGPLGCELAQAFCRLGSAVTIVQNEAKFLPREERDAAELLARAMARDGVVIRLDTTVEAAHAAGGVKMLDTVNGAQRARIETDEILVSVGRVPNVADLQLAAAGIEFDPERGIKVDDLLRTSNANVFAAGDVCMSHQFTNVAEITGRTAVRNAWHGQSTRCDELLIPWCTFCDPEIAHVGLQAWEARERAIPVKTYTVLMQDVDRAITDGQDFGFVKIHIQDGSDKILGATIVSSRASEMINEISLIISAGIGMRALNEVLYTYPAKAAAIRMAAQAFVRGVSR